ncbi:MAG: hypothetical protein ACOY3Y_13130 [Acidobacteriota bacterium]
MGPDTAYLIEYMEKRFGAIEQQIADLKSGFDVLQSSVDAYATRADATLQERVAPSYTVHRHECSPQQAANQLGITLEY